MISADLLQARVRSSSRKAMSVEFHSFGQHSKAETTREVDMQQVGPETLAAVAKLEAAMLAATTYPML